VTDPAPTVAPAAAAKAGERPGEPRALHETLSHQLTKAIAQLPGLRALALIGSRARGDAHADSDWDFAFLGDDADDLALDLRVLLTEHLHTDRIDVVDLNHAGAVMRFQAARDGVPLVQRSPDQWDDFCVEAALFWCDMGPVIVQAQKEFLASLGPAPQTGSP
jgi:predicted nucleotidyltransferase